MSSMGGTASREPDRVRRNTPDAVQQRIDADLEGRVHHYASRPTEEIDDRIQELTREWSIERWLEMNASSLALSTLLLGITRDRRWLLATGLVLGFLLQHAVQGWCPPLPILRRLGVRTREEIEREKYALKFLRGDFRETISDPQELREAPIREMLRALRT